MEQLFPNAGWVEIDPLAIIESVEKCVEVVYGKMKEMGKNAVEEIKAIGISNQRGK